LTLTVSPGEASTIAWVIDRHAVAASTPHAGLSTPVSSTYRVAAPAYVGHATATIAAIMTAATRVAAPRKAVVDSERDAAHS
jgi:hypothetical protein